MPARLTLILVCAILTTSGCMTTVRHPILYPATPASIARLDSEQQGRREPTLKVHHHSGALDVLTWWSLQPNSVLEGLGARFDRTRDPATVTSGNVEISLDSIAYLEADVRRSVLTPVTGVVMGGVTYVAVLFIRFFVE
jgi:hypothetical protein